MVSEVLHCVANELAADLQILAWRVRAKRKRTSLSRSVVKVKDAIYTTLCFYIDGIKKMFANANVRAPL